MKKVLLTLVACVAIFSKTYAQWNPSGSSGNYYFVSGNLGIGTTSPSGSRKLLVYNNTLDVTSEFITETPTGANYGLRCLSQGIGADLNMALFATASGATSNMGLRIYNVAAGANNFSIYSDSPAQSYFQGNVAIGTTDPKGYKLAVAGDMIAEQVVVKLQANWPDYVFKPQYNLTALADLKAFIDKNHHLPEIPSAKEVAEKGINLGNMNKILVKKVEELTLYLIENDKKEKAQEDRINKLEQEVDSLLKIAKH